MQFELKTNELLSQYTTLHIGGAADYLAVVRSEAELKAALQFASKQTATPPLILGGGSNVLCSDEGYRGVVIVNKIAGYKIEDTEGENVILSIGAGEIFDDIIKKTIDDGFWGLENLSAIPGSVGATPIQNVGAYGVEISELIESVTAVNLKNNQQKIFTKADCKFSYRDSFFKTKAGKDWCVTEVQYQLSKTPKPVLSYKDLEPLREAENLSQQQIREHVIQVRGNKFPDWRKVGTAGSFFKNPIITNEQFNDLQQSHPDLPAFPVSETETKVSLGWILDKVCNLRGYKVNRVGLYEKQALVLVTEKGSTASEVESFVREIEETVKAKTGISIDREVLSV